MRLEDIKLTRFRTVNNMTKAAFAAIIFADPSKVTKVENGKSTYTDDQAALILRYFDAEDMPLSEVDTAATENRLYKMRNLAREGRTNEARAIWDDYNLHKLVNLAPCDDNLPILSRLFYVILLIAESNTDAAEKELDALKGKEAEMRIKHRYYFHYTSGTLAAWQVRDEDSMAEYEKALALVENKESFVPDDVERLHYNIAVGFTRLEYPYEAISHLERIKALYAGKMTGTFGLRVDLALAANYIIVNKLKVAEKMLKHCHATAIGVNDNFYIGVVMRCYGDLHRKKGDIKVAIDYLSKAVESFKEGIEQHFSAFRLHIQYVIDFRKFSRARKMLEQANALYGKHEVYAECLVGLDHYLIISSRKTGNNDESVAHLLNVSIPHFKKNNDYFKTVEYCKLLEVHFSKRKLHKKSLQMTEAIRNIYERCFLYMKGDELP